MAASSSERRVRFKDEGPVVVHYDADTDAPGVADPSELIDIPPPPQSSSRPSASSSLAGDDAPPPPASPQLEAAAPPPPSSDENSPAAQAQARLHSLSSASAAQLKHRITASANTTCNSLELAILTKQTTNLWAHRRTQHTPTSLSTSLEVTYCPMQVVAKSFYHTQHELKTQDDILVCSPQRCGQTAVLDALFQLCNQHGEPSKDRFEDFVGWVGSASASELPARKTSSGKRLFKTHMNLQPFTRTTGKAPKVIVVLRDPVYVLDSWRRHVLDVYGMFNPAEAGDMQSAFTLEDFKDCMPGAYNAGLGASTNLSGETYWKFISTALDTANKDKNVLVVFYEQIVSAPGELLDQLSQFVLGVPVFDEDVRQSVLKSWSANRRPLAAQEAEMQVPGSLRTVLGESWIKHFTGVFIEGMPVVPLSYYELFGNAGAGAFPLPMFPLEKQRSASRFASFSDIKRNVSNGNADMQVEVGKKLEEMKRLKNRAKSVVSRVAAVAIQAAATAASSSSASPSSSSSAAAAAASGGGGGKSPEGSRSNSITNSATASKRKSVYARVFG